MSYQKVTFDVPVLEIRRARPEDRADLEDLKARSIAKLLDPLLTPEERRELRKLTPFDPQLIEDGTYCVATLDDHIVASGGWSRRATLLAKEGSVAPILDPDHDAAGIRAMYVDPDFARRGLGSLVLSTALSAARIAGFRRAQLLATLAGERLYRAAGWTTEEKLTVGIDGCTNVPGFLMSRAL